MSYSVLNSIDGETMRVNAQNYSRFGAPTTNNSYASPKTGPTPSQREVECCLPGSLFNCPLLTDTSDCPVMMSNRCAKSFDDKCALYANTKAHSSMDDYRHFLRDTLRQRFCKLAPNSECVQSCTPFDPTAPNGSNMVCRVIGKEPMADVSINNSIDVGLNLPVNISPVYQGRCFMQCNAKAPAEIEATDPLISECIRTGFCSDILTQICQDTDVSKGANQLLKTFCGVKSGLSPTPSAPSSSAAGQPTYNDTYAYGTYSNTYSGSITDRAGKALTAIRQKLGGTTGVGAPSSSSDDSGTDHSLLWVIVLLVLFYAALVLVMKLRKKSAAAPHPHRFSH